jgi:predicted ester cyclase
MQIGEIPCLIKLLQVRCGHGDVSLEDLRDFLRPTSPDISSARLFNASAIAQAYASWRQKQKENKAVEERSPRAISARNKENYLKAKAAFNRKDMAGCMSYYAPHHHIRSRDVGPGRQHIERLLSSMHESWPDLVIVVEHAVAEDDWVVGRCTTTATHARTVMGAAPTNRQVQATFWDMHRFDADGLIVETWNLLDSLAIMQQLGLVPTPPK